MENLYRTSSLKIDNMSGTEYKTTGRFRREGMHRIWGSVKASSSGAYRRASVGTPEERTASPGLSHRRTTTTSPFK